MKTIIIKIGGMGCEHCKNTIEQYLNKQEGINTKVSLKNEKATVEYDEEKVTLEDIKRFIEETGYDYLGEE